MLAREHSAQSLVVMTSFQCPVFENALNLKVKLHVIYFDLPFFYSFDL